MDTAVALDAKLASSHTQPLDHDKWAVEIARLARAGITAEAILVELCAAWSYLQRMPHSVPSDRALSFALSRAIFALVPRPVRVSRGVSSKGHRSSIKATPKALEQAGSYLVQALAPILANVHRTIHDTDHAATAVVEAMRASFMPSVDAMTKAAKAAAAAPTA